MLSSLHTNDAPTAIPRLIDLGLPPFLIAAVLNMIEAQRLVRMICQNCIVSYKLTNQEIEAIKQQISDVKKAATDFKIPAVFYKGAGCDICGNSGYKGRLGIFEILDIDEDIRKLIVEPNFTLDALRDTAQKKGMRTMFEDGLKKIEKGLTTIEEVLRVIRE